MPGKVKNNRSKTCRWKMRKYTGFLTLKLLLLISIAVFPQNQDYRFTQLTTEHGLSQSNITCILQDSKGFMWFGTFNGLNRFDGYDFKVFNYTHEDNQGISHNYVSSLFQDKNGYLWVGTSDGLNRYDYEKNTFKAYKNKLDKPGSIIENQIQTILEDSQARLWIGTRKGELDLFNPLTESFTHHFYNKDDKNRLSGDGIGQLFEDSDGNLWVARLDGSIDIINETGGQIESGFIYREKITDAPITAIVESADKNIWIGTQGDGLYRVKLENGQIGQIAHYSKTSARENSISSNIILCLMVESISKLWIGTEDAGISILDMETNDFQFIRHDPLNESSLNHDSVWQVYKDRAGNIWVGTYGYGINLLSGNKSFIQHHYYRAENKASLSHNMVNSFFEDQNSNIWIATDGGGLNLFDRTNNKFAHYDSENSNIDTDVIISLLVDRRNRLWVGSWTNGLYQFNPSTKRFTKYTGEEHGLGSNRILHIFEDRQAGLWLSTFYGGLTYFDADDQSVVVYDTRNSGLSDNYTRVVHQDFDGNLWIGTDSGVDFFDTKTTNFRQFKNDRNDSTSLSSGFVHSIIQTADSAIWIGTTGGLDTYNSEAKSFIHYDTDDGLPNNVIKSIIEDKNGILWLSTNKGISRFDRKAETFKNYDISDGLQGNEFNVNSGWRTSFGEILFGGNNGFNIFQPADLRINTIVPPVLLTNFEIFNQPVAIGGQEDILQKHVSASEKITLSYEHAVFSFDFVALNYVSPEKNQYAYMMEGFDSNWNYVGPARTATYTNLDPGDYVFKVKASNNDGFWNEEGAAIRITINPPFWKTWWAYLIEFVFVIASMFLVINYYVSRQRLKNALKVERVELEKMYELDQMRTRLFTNISHECHSPLTLILAPLEKLISSHGKDDKTQNSLKLIHRSAQRLQRMINQLKNFQKIESGDLHLRLLKGDIILFVRDIVHLFQDYAIDHHIQYRFNTSHDRFTAWFDPDTLDKIIYNVLSNAFKFTPDEGLIAVDVSIINSENRTDPGISVDMASQYIEIVVSDSGIGIQDDKIEHIFERYYRAEKNNGQHYPGSGIGLAFAYELIKLYQGEISVKSSEGKGSEFTIRIPIDEQFLEERQVISEFGITDNGSLASGDFSQIDENAVADAGVTPRELREKSMPVVLIVEDDTEMSNFIKNSLQSKYRIYCVESGKEGVRCATDLIPDLVISDIKMPEVTGIQLCHRLKEDEKTSHIPIILITGHSSQEYKIEGLSKGADAYLSKPFNIDELDVQISNLLQTRIRLKEKYCRQILLEPTQMEIEDIDEKFLQRVIATIEGHISDVKLNAETLSKELGMSRMQLYRKLRGLTNLTVHEFIQTIRLKRAIQLLKGKRMTITEVAYEVGFNDLTYFARCFRKIYKKSPSEFISDKN